jgi:hypothetical protein
VLKRAPTVVRAADGLIIPFLGIADITFCLNVDGKHKFNHTFWIATENKSCKTNLIGMDWIRNHCKGIQFDTNTIGLREFPDVRIPVSTVREKPFPYYTKIFQINSRKNSQIKPKNGRIFKFESDALRFIPRGTEYIPTTEMLECGLVIFGTAIEQKQDSFPMAMENYTDHIVTLAKKIGYLQYNVEFKTEKNYHIEDLPLFSARIMDEHEHYFEQTEDTEHKQKKNYHPEGDKDKTEQENGNNEFSENEEEHTFNPEFNDFDFESAEGMNEILEELTQNVQCAHVNTLKREGLPLITILD